jgi:protein ImuB
MGRFVAMAFIGLRIELARTRGGLHKEDRVLGVVIARDGGAVKDESSLLGNTRLDEVSPEARAIGIRPGQTIASARARSADLRVRVVPLLSVSQALSGLAEMAFAFGATTSFEAGGFAGDVVWVDVTGCGHLHASGRDKEGERTLLLRLSACVEKLGYSCRIAIADGPRIAAAVARYMPARSQREWSDPIVVPRGENAKAITKLPLAALALEKSTLAWLSALGVKRVADLQTLPRLSLGTRLGGDAARVMALIDGDDRAPLTAYVPPELPTEKVDFEYGIESAEALLFVAKRLADRIAARLEGRCLKAACLELTLHLDRGVKHLSEEDPILTVTLASPLARSEELFSILKAKVEGNACASMRAPTLGVTLRVTEAIEARAEALDLLTPETKALRALPRLASELSAELGHAAVGMLVLRDTWVMADRSRLVPFRRTPPPSPFSSALLAGGAEPTRWLEEPMGVRRASLLHARMVARFESLEWWNDSSGARPDRVNVRDHYPAWVDGGRGETGKRGMAWVEVERETGRARVMGWLD